MNKDMLEVSIKTTGEKDVETRIQNFYERLVT